MTKLLLDFPWELPSILNTYSDAHTAFHDFQRLCETELLDPVRFVSENDYAALLADPNLSRIGKNVLRPVLQLLPRYLRVENPVCVPAAPVGGPNDLPDVWKLALADELNLNDWRTPQIVFCRERHNDWAHSRIGVINRTEARVQLEDGENADVRVLASLESYKRHWYARSDRDPWDLQRTKLPARGAPQHQQHPCSLPKPPQLDGVALQELSARARVIRNWDIQDRYYFIPSENWDPDEIDKERWRAGETFPEVRCPHCNRRRPVDYAGRVWCWDQTHRHWDVQFPDGGYWSVSHTGQLIKRKNQRGIRRSRAKQRKRPRR